MINCALDKVQRDVCMLSISSINLYFPTQLVSISCWGGWVWGAKRQEKTHKLPQRVDILQSLVQSKGG